MSTVTKDDFMVRYTSPLIGAEVLKFSNGYVAWIMCDEEGNGPGHLDIQYAGKEKLNAT